MQREIKNKTVTYGIAAVLLACILTATVYNFGIQPIVPEESGIPPQAEVPSEPGTPSEPSLPSDPNAPSNPSSPPQPNIPPPPNSQPEPTSPPEPETPPVLSELKTFSSYDELENFINVNVEKGTQLNGLPFLSRATETFDSQTFGGEASTAEYSTTNVQVAGVDEADVVKSDGEYLYVVSSSYIYILKAYPTAQAEVVSKIDINETYGAQIYVNENKLVVLANYDPYSGYNGDILTEMAFAPYFYREEMFVKVYDLTDKANPVLSRTMLVNGSLSGSRMIGDYVYVVVNQEFYQTTENGTEVFLPMIFGDYVREIQPTEIHYIDAPDVSYRLTTVIAVNVMNDAQEPTYEPFLTGYSTDIYVSLNNMYLVAPNTNWYFIMDSEDEPQEETLIYRIALNQESVVVMNEGTVPGYVLNQFSMDEHNGFFRIATTTNNWWTDPGPTNNLFIMNMNLTIVGSLEGLAENETIYSARFMGNRSYIVTFRNIDPLFVIDLTDPTAPTVLGSLKVTGYSGYLHPYDENYIIGIGKETEASDREDFAWYQGVKISLFDVSDVSNPVEVAKYEIGDRGTDSPILTDHKALLFDKEKNLLVIPVLERKIDPNEYPPTLYPDGVPPSAYGKVVGQGAYVFSISPDGIELRGIITHIEDGADLENNYWLYSEYFVERSLYIDNVLYTVSDKLVKMNDLESLDLLNEIELS